MYCTVISRYIVRVVIGRMSTTRETTTLDCNCTFCTGEVCAPLLLRRHIKLITASRQTASAQLSEMINIHILLVLLRQQAEMQP